MITTKQTYPLSPSILVTVFLIAEKLPRLWLWSFDFDFDLQCVFINCFLKIKVDCMSGLFCIPKVEGRKKEFFDFTNFEPPPNQNEVKYSHSGC